MKLLRYTQICGDEQQPVVVVAVVTDALLGNSGEGRRKEEGRQAAYAR